VVTGTLSLVLLWVQYICVYLDLDDSLTQKLTDTYWQAKPAAFLGDF